MDFTKERINGAKPSGLIRNDPVTTEYQLHVSTEPGNASWDSFLTKVPGGHHVQTGLWAQLKSLLGWNVHRIVVTSREKQIIGGAQILVRSYRFPGKIGIISKGPVFAIPDPELVELVTREIVRVSRQNKIQYLIVQPPNNSSSNDGILTRYGFQPAVINIAHTSTVLVDLTKDVEAIMAGMNQSTRRNIRLAQRKGITYREGTESDLSAFYNAYRATSKRKGFASFPFEYYERMWDLFAPPGYARLFMAEREGEVVSAQLAVAFGDTVINKMSGWSGKFSECRPNEGLYWHVIKWAREQGYHYYDLEGVNPEAARTYLESRKIPEPYGNTFSKFKLGFGGQIESFPDALIFISNPILHTAYRIVIPRISKSRLMTNILGRLRTY